MQKKLIELYNNQTNLVSDKWSSYIPQYQLTFSPYEEKKVKILEIGVQNGGSLEIWSKYFLNAEKIIGCDIDEKCSTLKFSSPVVEIITGDITNSKTLSKIATAAGNNIDIVIDDGSHTSTDIISTFLYLFPIINEGGVFVAEDLHCSYWPEFEGGLQNPSSTISFFKALADIINFEHWRASESRTEYLRKNFSIPHDCEDSLAALHSVEFVNSMCIIRKSNVMDSTLGKRLIVGSVEPVCSVKKKNGEILNKPVGGKNKCGT